MDYDKKAIEERGCMVTTDTSNIPQLETIKQIREYYKMSQIEFAIYLNVPRRTVENWESPKRTPPKDYIIELIKYKFAHDPVINNRLYSYYARLK